MRSFVALLIPLLVTGIITYLIMRWARKRGDDFGIEAATFAFFVVCVITIVVVLFNVGIMVYYLPIWEQ